MSTEPSQNLLQGIRLVQSGQKQEALRYLRYAARHESLTSEGWLWLAAATDDLEEYRFCVEQALTLDGAHPIARRMRQAMNDTAQVVSTGNQYGFYSPSFAPSGHGDGEQTTGRYDTHAGQPRSSLFLRLLRAVVILAIIGGVVGGVAALVMSGVVQDAVEDWLTSSNELSLEFTVSETPAFRFRLDVPQTWMPANSDNPSWRDTRDALADSFGVSLEGSVWDQIDSSFSAAVRDQVYGQMLPSVRIVETDAIRLEESGVVTALTLHAIKAYPADVLAELGDVCGRMEAIKGEHSTPGTGATILSAKVITRPVHDDCVLVVDRRVEGTDKAVFPVMPERVPDAMREVLVAVPVEQERYAVWRVTLADAAYDSYARDIERVIDTLVYVP